MTNLSKLTQHDVKNLLLYLEGKGVLIYSWKDIENAIKDLELY